MRTIINILLFFIAPLCLFGQNGSIVIEDNANILMVGNVNLITLQSSNQGIQKTGNFQGGIISDNEQSRVIWQIGTGIGNYIIPFKISNTQIPLSINITAAGIGVGKLLLSTYHSAINNTTYPNGNGYFSSVTNMDLNGVDNSANVVDRFWMINYDGYTTLPTSQFAMTYDAANDLNGIIENDLQAQYWNGLTWILPPTGIASPVSDNVNTIPSVIQNAPWVLVNKLIPLDIELSEFSGECIEGGMRKIYWITQSEYNIWYFRLKQSFDGQNYQPVGGTIQAAGNSNTVQYYEFIDTSPYETNVYYKLCIMDDGFETESAPMVLNCSVTSNEIIVYPNPSHEGEAIMVLGDVYSIEIHDMIGRIVNAKIEQNKIFGLASGAYIFVINGKYEGKIIVQ